MLRLTNTLSGKKEEFIPQKSNKVSLYVCGITPYSRSHIGHARVYVGFDVLYRLLKFLGYEVTYVRNFTDIDDKLLKKASELYGKQEAFIKIADEQIVHYHHEMKELNTLNPQYEPRVTENIDTIIEFIQGLIDEGVAYKSNGDVYFRVKSFPEYGKLSKQRVDELRAGARIEVGEKKEDPLDFALWKGEKEGTFWNSPFGYGRPGWHIECSALAKKYLGSTIDIHAGGLDLQFPHHENEIAQSESLHNAPFARYWLHNGLVKIDKEKMSKSLGNVLAIHEMFEHYDPQLIRFYFLNHHYRAPLDFSFDEVEQLRKGYNRLARVFSNCKATQITYDKLVEYPIAQKMINFLLDDLNTVGMLGVVFEHLDDLEHNKKECAVVKAILHDVAGLTLQPLKQKEVGHTPEVTALLEEREKARKEKDWHRADQIRDKLTAMGIEFQDRKIN